MTDVRDLLTLSRDFGEASGYWGSCLPVIYGLAVGINAKDILEIGVNRGGSTRALLLAARQTGGRVTSIDINDCEVSADWTSNRWRFIQADSRKVLPALAGRQFDFTLIDGEHTADAVAFELGHITPMMRRPGIICLDDCWVSNKGVLDAFQAYLPPSGCTKSLVPYGSRESWGGLDRTFGLVRFHSNHLPS